MVPEIILGPPGTGKTTALLNIVEEELEKGLSPKRIAFLSFTKKAGDEAITRACKRFNLTREHFPYFRTIHSLCYHQLSLTPRDVLNLSQLRVFSNWAGVRITGRVSEDGSWKGFETGDRIVFLENLARVKEVTLRRLYDEGDDFLPWNEVDRVVRALELFKTSNRLIDFTGMLSYFLAVGRAPPIEVLLVDESQDLSKLQWRVIDHLAKNVRRLIVAGDDDQSIFNWAGADEDRLLSMNGTVKVLRQSYRVPLKIQKLSNSIIEKIDRRYAKDWDPRKGKGPNAPPIEGIIEYKPNIREVDLTKGRVLILARNSYILSEQVEPELQQAGFIYGKNETSSIDPQILSAIIYWEDLRKGASIPSTELAKIGPYINISRKLRERLDLFRDPNQTVDKVYLKSLNNPIVLPLNEFWYDAFKRLPITYRSYIRAARRRGEKIIGTPRIQLSTIHGAKGGEADHVVLYKEMARRTYREIESNVDSERRVWYVGVTRAREKLSIIESLTKQSCPWI